MTFAIFNSNFHASYFYGPRNEKYRASLLTHRYQKQQDDGGSDRPPHPLLCTRLPHTEPWEWLNALISPKCLHPPTFLLPQSRRTKKCGVWRFVCPVIQLNPCIVSVEFFGPLNASLLEIRFQDSKKKQQKPQILNSKTKMEKVLNEKS